MAEVTACVSPLLLSRAARFSGISRASEVGRSDVPVHGKQIARTSASADDDVGQKRIGVVNGKWVIKSCRVRSGTVNNYTDTRLCRDTSSDTRARSHFLRTHHKSTFSTYRSRNTSYNRTGSRRRGTRPGREVFTYVH